MFDASKLDNNVSVSCSAYAEICETDLSSQQLEQGHSMALLASKDSKTWFALVYSFS